MRKVAAPINTEVDPLYMQGIGRGTSAFHEFASSPPLRNGFSDCYNGRSQPALGQASTDNSRTTSLCALSPMHSHILQSPSGCVRNRFPSAEADNLSVSEGVWRMTVVCIRCEAVDI